MACGVPSFLNIQIAGEELQLLPERGLFWERSSTLMLADWHVGKSAAFRAAGIAVPEGDLVEEIGRVAAMLDRTGAENLVVLGDFVHAASSLSNTVVGQVEAWFEEMEQRDTRVSLVSGNHDRSAGISRIGKLGIELLPEVCERAPFVLRHEPGASEDGYVLAGHIHPAVRLGEGKAGGLRAPCFWFGKECGVLPAFGGFTGGRRVDAQKGDRVFAVGGGEVIEVPQF